MIEKERLQSIFKEIGVMREGHFQFTSGRHSSNYMQCATILQYPEFTEEIIRGLVKEFKDDNVDIVVGPAIGGIAISYEFAKQLGVRSFFTEREQNKMVLRRGFCIPRGARCLVVEDVITTGDSVREVIDIINSQGGIVVGVAVIVDRSGGEITFGTKLKTAYSKKLISYPADYCPLCKEGKIPLEKPGSRGMLNI